MATVLLAFGLRLFRLTHHDIWGDEAFSIYLSKQVLSSVVAGGADTHPPLYHFLLHFWILWMGRTQFVVRFLSVGVGLLIVPTTYKLGQKLFGRRVGVLAAGTTAIAPFLIYYSQETRMYALVALLSELSVLMLVLALNKKKLICWLAYWLVTALSLYAHYYAFFVLFAQNIYLLAARKRYNLSLWYWFPMQGSLVVAYLPWLLAQTAFLQGRAGTDLSQLSPASLGTLWARSLIAFSLGTTVELSIARYLVWGFLFVAGWGGVHLLRRSADRNPGWLVILYLLVPMLAAGLVNPLLPFFQERFLLLVAPAFHLLLAVGLVEARERYPFAWFLLLPFLLLSGAYSLSNYYFEQRYAKGEYGALMTYVEEHGSADDALIVYYPIQQALFDYYRPRGPTFYIFPKEYPLEDPRTDQDLQEIVTHHPRVWLVMYGDPAAYDPKHLIETRLSRWGYKSFFRSYRDGSLSLYVTSPVLAEEVIEFPLQANLDNEVLLLGYTLNTNRVEAGETLLLTLYWQALRRMEKDYTVFTHLLDGENRIWGQMDGQPVGGTYPTSRWQVGEMVVDRYGLPVSPEAPPGEYEIEVGMYLLTTMERLPVLDQSTHQPLPDQRVTLGKVQVVRTP
ncbi:MAG: glycosyltransferase family 39 protein [Anaerolineae bacterium]